MTGSPFAAVCRWCNGRRITHAGVLVCHTCDLVAEPELETGTDCETAEGE